MDGLTHIKPIAEFIVHSIYIVPEQVFQQLTITYLRYLLETEVRL